MALSHCIAVSPARIALLACIVAASVERGQAAHPKQPPNQLAAPKTNEDASAPMRSSQIRTLADERKHLSERLDAECDKLIETLAHSSGEQRAGILNQLARLGTARAIGVVSDNYDNLKSQDTLVNIVASSGNPASAPLLLRVA